LGANGAGKTTLLKILAGLVLPDDGQVKVNGVDVTGSIHPAGHQMTYISGEERSHYWRLSGRENLRFVATLDEVPWRQVGRRVQEVLEVVGLGEAADHRVGTYSSGMKQRLGIARGLLSRPEILLLDEPTRSLDPLSAKHLGEFIKEDLVEQRGRTVVLATHNMEEATLVCDRVAILHRGEVKRCETVAAIVASLTGQYQYSITFMEETLTHENLLVTADKLSEIKGVGSVILDPANGHYEHSVGSTVELTVDEPEVQIPLILAQLLRDGAKVIEVNRKRSSLIDAIVAVTVETK
jgi:ABC-2 type transport system ATP-binding protein